MILNNTNIIILNNYNLPNKITLKPFYKILKISKAAWIFKKIFEQTGNNL